MDAASVTYCCPCCGHPGLTEPAYRDLPIPSVADLAEVRPPYASTFGDPSHDICSCCGFEFGFDDDTNAGDGSSFEEYLAEWIAEGCPWFMGLKPGDWNLEQQLHSSAIDKKRICALAAGGSAYPAGCSSKPSIREFFNAVHAATEYREARSTDRKCLRCKRPFVFVNHDFRGRLLAVDITCETPDCFVEHLKVFDR